MNAQEPTVYRGRTVAEILPKIREELGPDAIVVAQREGLAGGVAGFFQHPYVEIEARRPAVDLYDEEPEPEGAPDFQEELQAAALLDEASRITAEAALAGLHQAPIEGPAPTAGAATGETPVAAQQPPAEGRAATLAQALTDAGLPEALAAEIVGEAVTHGVPFGSPRGLRRLVRGALARRIPAAPAFAGRRRAVAVVGAAGAGKTLVASRLAAAYASGSDIPARLVSLHARDEDFGRLARLHPLGVEVAVATDAGAAADRLWPAGGEGLAVVDTPAASPNDVERVAALGADLRAMDLDEVHLALPATLSKPAAAHVLDALAPLGVTHLVLTHSDETPCVGPVVALAIERGLPFSFVSGGDELPGGLAPADPDELAGRLLA